MYSLSWMAIPGSRKTVAPRIPTKAGRNTSGVRRPLRNLLAPFS